MKKSDLIRKQNDISANPKMLNIIRKNSRIFRKTFILVMVLLLTGLAGNAQTRTIRGTVTDDTGSVIPGASVVVKGTSRGTVTDLNGNYTILKQKRDEVLVFAFVGFETQEVEIGEKTVINVQLVSALVGLTEVVVVGYGTKNRRQRGNRPVIAVEAEASASYFVVDSDVGYYLDFNTESYSAINETGFRDVLRAPLSTFSIDVDNAAYSNVRRFLNTGQLPPSDAARIEELLNYFHYDYPEPDTNHPYGLHTELSECPWNPEAQLLKVGLKAKDIAKDELPPSNLVFLIDVSGSMSPANRLPLVKTAMNMLVEELRPTDRVSIVVYSGSTEILLESTPASEKRKIIRAIESLRAGGYTAGGQALRMAYSVAEENFIEGGNNRIIMATDGDFNVGESSNAAMERLVEEEREKGVFITVLGFGMGNYKDDRLEIIANKGNGNYAYIDNIQEARKVFVSEFAGTLFTVAKDVKLQIEFNPQRVKAYRLIGYENRRLKDEDFNNDAKDAGEMGAGHTVTALYEIIPAGSDAAIPGIDQLKYQDNPAPVKPNLRAELLTIKTRYKLPDGDESILFDKVVKGNVIPLSRTSDDFRFASAVAEYGLILSNSEFKANSDYDNIIKRALGAKGKDEEGYRAEFINLVRTAKNLDNLSVRK